MKSGGFEKLHFGQINSNFDAHLPQNIMPSGFSNWHFGHFILSPPETFLIENVARKNKRTLNG